MSLEVVTEISHITVIYTHMWHCGMKIYFLFRIMHNYLKIFLNVRALHIVTHTPVLYFDLMT